MTLKNNIIIYKDLISLENLKAGLIRTKNNVSPGLDGETKSDINENRLQKLFQELIAQKYQPTPSKKIGIPKPDGGIRYLGIASQIDKVVQAAILNKLEPILEDIFLRESFGFRPKLGCHNALKKIKYQWKAVNWVISIDIKKFFDRVHHEFLLKLLEKYCDQATIELIRKLLKVGYVDVHNLNDRTRYTTLGTPQGSLISPIFSNLYLHELDLFVVNELYPLFNKGECRPKNPEYAKRYTQSDTDKLILSDYPELKKALNRAKHNKFVMSGRFTATDGEDPNYRRLHYVRYVDDFLLGFIGPKKEAELIVEKIKVKLESLKLELNDQKSRIFHSSDAHIKFLGVYLRYFTHNKIKHRKDSLSDDNITNQVPALMAQAVNTVHFRAPVDEILDRLVNRSIAKKNMDGTIRATAYLRLSMLEDYQIVNRYSAIIKGFLNYYSCINHRSDLWKVFHILRKSCALTLANKYKLGSAARIYLKFGPELTIKETTGKIKTSLFYPKSLKTDIDFKISSTTDSVSYQNILELELNKVQGSTKLNEKTSDKCQYEGCEVITNLEVYHLRPMAHINKRKDLSTVEKAIIPRKRKTVMLCKKHHNEMHSKGLFTKDSKVGSKDRPIE